MKTAPQPAAIETSRRKILEELGDPPDLVVVRDIANRADELVWRGTRDLLSNLIYREVPLSELCSSAGHTAVLLGGEFWHPGRDHMDRALAVAGLRFERVIVLPSSFDFSRDRVRESLARTSATVFASEEASFRRVQALCDARLAHDCSFFFDFAPFRGEGRGVLNAFSGNGERTQLVPQPPDHDDVSLTASSFEEWLQALADHEVVRTDRAHVMIAAALLGKRVEFDPSPTLEAIAGYALSDYPVSALPTATVGQPAGAGNRRVGRTWSPARVTAVVLSHDQAPQALRAVDSLPDTEVSLRTLVLDNNSPPAAQRQLAEGCAGRDQVLLRRSDRNLGCAGGRCLALEDVDSELVLFLDDDAELERGALDRLVAELDRHPQTLAVTATVEMPDGTIHHSGGWTQVSESVARFGLIGARQPVDTELPPTGSADWIPGTAMLVRRAALEEFPIDARMSAHYEDNEWCYRVERSRPGSFRRSREARAIHYFAQKHFAGVDFASRSVAIELLGAHARFYERHGKLADIALFDLVPELRDPGGDPDIAATRLLMELILAKGTDWTFIEWMNGDLDVLLSAGRRAALQASEIDQQKTLLARQAELLAYLHYRHDKLSRVEAGGWWRLRARLLPVLHALWWLRRSARR